jgi:hypothetical protein
MKPIISFSLPEEDPFFSAILGPKWSIWVEQIRGKPVNALHPNAPFCSKERRERWIFF